MQTVLPERPLRLIVDPPASGPWNMAVDEALLADAVDNGVATLRLYEWDEPTLSLGYFQRYEDRDQHDASRHAAIVRRQSGGGAIVHDRELTYSLALPATHSLARDADELYTAVHEAMIAVLAPHVAAAASGWGLRLRCGDCVLPIADEPFLCFQRQARGDLLLVRPTSVPSADFGKLSPGEANSPGYKILGSAQRRRRGAILQHGSLLLGESPAAPELAGLNDLAGTRLSAAAVAAELQVHVSIALQMRLQESRLPDDLRVVAAELESRKYGVPAWTKRR